MEYACPSACRSGYALLPFKKKIFCTAFPVEPSARIENKCLHARSQVIGYKQKLVTGESACCCPRLFTAFKNFKFPSLSILNVDTLPKILPLSSLVA